MGRATGWLRSLLGSSKKSSSTSPVTKTNRKFYSSSISNFKPAQLNSSVTDSITRKSGTWGGDELYSTSYVGSIDANKHAIAVAAATAAVAEAAIAAAQAAAEVVRLTNAGTSRSIPSPCGGGGRGGSYHSREDRREVAAAIKIQSAFRAYLARKALRALKGLVKLQAIVRGRIVRKQSADMLRRMQALARIQARACASRAYITGSSQPFSKSSLFHLAGNTKFSKYNQQHPLGINCGGPTLKSGGTKSRLDHNVKNVRLDSSWLDRWMDEESTWNHIDADSRENLGTLDEKSDKILEIDTWHPQISPRQSTHHFTTSVFSTKYQKPHPSVSSGEISSLNSPYGKSASSRRNAFTPTRSECSRSFFGEYAGYPNYMTYTESSMAKVRSQSVPPQRMVLPEKVAGGSRQLVYGRHWDVETSSEKGLFVHGNLRSKAHYGSVHKYRNKV